MTIDAVLPLLDAGALTGGVTLGVALGSPALYERCRHERRFRFRPVTATHGLAALAGIGNFVSINSVLEVDLFGQAVADVLCGRQISGPGGRSILALPSVTADGRISRIVAQFAAGTPATVARAEAHIVVTEHGAAELRARSLDGRAEALIAIAAPQHRAELANTWDRMRRAMN